MHEIKKIYDLDFLEDEQVEPRIIGRTESLAFSTGRFAIKFIQNLCEGHNRTYQNKFFEFEFDKDEYLKDNKNIYLEGKSKNFNSAYTNFVKLSRKSFQAKMELAGLSEQKEESKLNKRLSWGSIRNKKHYRNNSIKSTNANNRTRR